MAFAVPTSSQEPPLIGSELSVLPSDRDAGFSPGPKTQTLAQTKAQRQYQRAQIENASPARLVVMLYDGAIRFCLQGREAMAARQLEDQNESLLKAQRILLELIGALDQKTGGEIAANLMQVYSHLLERLIHANLKDDAEALTGVVSILQELRESWSEAERMVAQMEGRAS